MMLRPPFLCMILFAKNEEFVIIKSYCQKECFLCRMAGDSGNPAGKDRAGRIWV